MAGRKPGLPENLHEAVLVKAAEGMGTRELAAWLGKEHGVQISHAAVARHLERLRSERAEVTRAVIAERVGKSVTADLDRLDRHAARLDRIATDLAVEDPGTKQLVVSDYDALTKVLGEMRKLTDTKRKWSGVGKDGEPPAAPGAKPAIDPAEVADLEAGLAHANSGGGDHPNPSGE